MPLTVQIYIFSGILMLIGVYLTIKYTPKCIISNVEMILQRKKILNESMHKEEIQLLNNYEKNGLRYNIGSFILVLSVLVHILSIIEALGEHITIVHYLGIACSILIYTAKSGYRSNCFRNMYYPYSLVLTSNENTLNGINLYFKNLRGEQLDEDELKAYSIYKYDVKEVVFVRYAINFGIILLLILDILFGYLNIMSLSLNR